jgi:hypothetical protein
MGKCPLCRGCVDHKSWCTTCEVSIRFCQEPTLLDSLLTLEWAQGPTPLRVTLLTTLLTALVVLGGVTGSWIAIHLWHMSGIPTWGCVAAGGSLGALSTLALAMFVGELWERDPTRALIALIGTPGVLAVVAIMVALKPPFAHFVVYLLIYGWGHLMSQWREEPSG